MATAKHFNIRKPDGFTPGKYAYLEWPSHLGWTWTTSKV
jgi:hypothetical protein